MVFRYRCWLWISFGTMLLLSGASLHKYYVSISTIDINDGAGTFECTLKMFTDDLEKALSVNSTYRITLDKFGQNALADSLVQDYVSRNFTIGLTMPTDGGERARLLLDCQFIGFETETDLTWVYVEFKKPANGIYSIKNACLTELFGEQQNIVHIRKDGQVVNSILQGRDSEFKDFELK